jgi:hypothetical protein
VPTFFEQANRVSYREEMCNVVRHFFVRKLRCRE